MALKLPQIGGINPPQRGTPSDPSNPWEPLHLRRDFARRDAEFLREDAQNHKRGRDIEVGAVPMTPPDPTKVNPIRLILTSPNGTRWSILVDDAGALSTVAI